MAAGTQEITVEAGASFRLEAVYRNPSTDNGVTPGTLFDLTGYTAKMQVRTKAGAEDPPLIDLSTENGGITLGDTAGTIQVFITREQTFVLQGVKTAAYDLYLIPPNSTTEAIRLIKGKVIIDKTVTVIDS